VSHVTLNDHGHCSVKAKGLHELQVFLNGVNVKGSPLLIIGRSDNELCVGKSEVFPLDGFVSKQLIVIGAAR
jgi:hypothetical protein